MPSGLGARRSFTRSLGQSRALRLHFGTSTRPFGVATRSPGAATRSVDGTSVTIRDQHSVTPYGTSRVRYGASRFRGRIRVQYSPLN